MRQADDHIPEDPLFPVLQRDFALFDAVMPGRYYLEYTLPEKAIFAKTVAGGNEISDEGTTGRTESFDFVTGETKAAPLCGAVRLVAKCVSSWDDPV